MVSDMDIPGYPKSFASKPAWFSRPRTTPPSPGARHGCLPGPVRPMVPVTLAGLSRASPRAQWLTRGCHLARGAPKPPGGAQGLQAGGAAMREREQSL